MKCHTQTQEFERNCGDRCRIQCHSQRTVKHQTNSKYESSEEKNNQKEKKLYNEMYFEGALHKSGSSKKMSLLKEEP